jgi:hypothetical protein
MAEFPPDRLDTYHAWIARGVPGKGLTQAVFVIDGRAEDYRPVTPAQTDGILQEFD